MPDVEFSRGVVPDYIPAEVSPPQGDEKHRAVRTVRPAYGGVVPDYVPSPDAEGLDGTVPIGDPDSQREASFAAVAAGVERDAKESYERAKSTLRGLTAPQAIDHMRTLSPFERNVFLVAESRNLKRKTLLDFFGPPDPDVEAKFFKKPRKKSDGQKAHVEVPPHSIPTPMMDDLVRQSLEDERSDEELRDDAARQAEQHQADLDARLAQLNEPVVDEPQAVEPPKDE